MCFQQPLRSWRNDLSFSTVIVKLASGLKKTVTWGLSNSSIREKNWPKTFPHWNTCLFFKELSFQQPLRSWRNDLITSIVSVRLVSGPSKTVPWGLSHSIMKGRIGHKLFFTGKFAFFPKNCVFNNLLAPKELILYFPQYLTEYLMEIYKLFPKVCHNWWNHERLAKNFCHHENSKFRKISCYRPLTSQRKNFINWKIIVKQTLWTIKTCILTFVIFDIKRKKGAKSFLHWKDCLFFQKVVFFQQPLRSWRNDLSFSSVLVRLASGLIETVPWVLSNSNIR